MQLITNTVYYPSSILTVEAQTVFNLESLIKGIYSKPSTDVFPHSFVEAESVYGSPVIQKRTVPTPSDGIRLIYQVAFQLRPGAGFDASGLWNHVISMSSDLTLPS